MSFKNEEMEAEDTLIVAIVSIIIILSHVRKLAVNVNMVPYKCPSTDATVPPPSNGFC